MSERVAIGILISVMTCFLILVIALVAFGVREFIWMCRETHENERLRKRQTDKPYRED